MQNQSGSRQEQILTILLATKTGLSIDAIAEKLNISSNWVAQLQLMRLWIFFIAMY
jgi:predicted ArsR family transcriptional regulator